MSLPHDYYSHDKYPRLHEKHNDALYADPDYLANEHDDVLPLHSTIGIGPQGRGSLPKEKDASDIKGTFIVQFVDDNTGEVLLESPNLHAGIISAETDELHHHLTLNVKRNNFTHTIAEMDLPEGAPGSRAYTVPGDQTVRVSQDYLYSFKTKELVWEGKTIEDRQPQPRIWDIIFANILDPFNKQIYIATGLILSSDENTTVAIFRTRYKLQDKLYNGNHIEIDKDNHINIINFATEADVDDIFKGGKNGTNKKNN